MLAEIWRATAIMMVILVSGMGLIPKEYYEAGEVFGANGWQRFIKITLPMLRPSLQSALILRTLAAFEVFAVVTAVVPPREDAALVNSLPIDQAPAGVRVRASATYAVRRLTALSPAVHTLATQLLPLARQILGGGRSHPQRPRRSRRTNRLQA